MKGKDKTFKDEFEGTERDEVANRFALAILMPKKLFIQQYTLLARTYHNKNIIHERLARYFKVPVNLVALRVDSIINETEEIKTVDNRRGR